MNKSIVIRSCVILISVLLAVLVSIAGGLGGAQIGVLPVFTLCAIVAFSINWMAFIPAIISQTEKYYDLTGSLTYLSVIGTALWLSPLLDTRAILVALMVCVWAVRLGAFLFLRIKRDGKDDRFDQIKTDPLRFFLTWTLQGLWVVLTAACALAIITGPNQHSMGVVGWIGFAIWVFGFSIEVIADNQKSNFKRNSENKGAFITSGLWSWSRHPNYFGEMVLWAGVAVMATPVFVGWQWLCLISPLFVYVLIAHVSGVNHLEAKADRKWGDDPIYKAYKRKTSILLLRPPTE